MTITHRPTRGLGLSDQFDPATAIASSCEGKQSFKSWDEADRVIKARQRNAKKPFSKKKKKMRSERACLRAYRCNYCHRWHISGSAR